MDDDGEDDGDDDEVNDDGDDSGNMLSYQPMVDGGHEER